MYLRQVSHGEFGAIHPSVDLPFEFTETASQRTEEPSHGCAIVVAPAPSWPMLDSDPGATRFRARTLPR